MKKIILTLAIASTLSYASSQYNEKQATILSLSCAGCHSTDGKSTSSIPPINGQTKE